MLRDLFTVRSLVTAGATLAVVAGLLLVPFSYERVVAHDVALTLGGANLSQDEMKTVAQELKSALHAEQVRVEMMSHGAAPELVFKTRVAGVSGRAGYVARAFAHRLEAKGYAATASVEPVRERVSDSVFAMARDQVIRISMDGKSADQIEAEILQGLRDAGISDASVSVETGDNMTRVEIRAESEGAESTGEGPQIMLTSGGEEIAGGEQHQIKVRKMAGDGGQSLVVEASLGDQSATATVPGYQSLSDGDLAAEIVRQLAAQGVNVNVNVEGGRISVMPAGIAGETSPSGRSAPVEKKATWGEVKQKFGKEGN